MPLLANRNMETRYYTPAGQEAVGFWNTGVRLIPVSAQAWQASGGGHPAILSGEYTPDQWQAIGGEPTPVDEFPAASEKIAYVPQGIPLPGAYGISWDGTKLVMPSGTPNPPPSTPTTQPPSSGGSAQTRALWQTVASQSPLSRVSGSRGVGITPPKPPRTVASLFSVSPLGPTSGPIAMIRPPTQGTALYRSKYRSISGERV